MREKLCTGIATILLFIPWTILPLRTFPWALQSPAAEAIVAGYAIFMLLSGVFSVLAYAKGKVRNRWMQICTVILVLYAAFGLAALAMMQWP